MLRNSPGKMLTLWVALMLVGLLFGEVTQASSDAGRNSAEFLQIGHGAKAAGMGGAYSAAVSGPIAAYWNPAGLAGTESGEISLGHFVWYQDITVEQADAAMPLGRGAALGLSVTHINYGRIDGYDAAGQATGELTVYDWAVGVSLGYPLTDQLSVGLTGKFVSQRLDEYSASAVAGDFGLRYGADAFALAAVLANVGQDMTFDQVAEKLPTAVRLAISARPFGDSFEGSVEVEKCLQGTLQIKQGVQFGFGDQYFLRSGLAYFPEQDGWTPETGLSVGAGVRFDFAEFDYAFAPNDKSLAEDLHRFSVKFSLGR